MPDGRYFIGRFTCTDSQSNIILDHAEEFRPSPQTDEQRLLKENRDMYYPKSQRGPADGPGWGKWSGEGGEIGQGKEEGRILGLVLIPGKDVVKMEVIDEHWREEGGERGVGGGMVGQGRGGLGDLGDLGPII